MTKPYSTVYVVSNYGDPVIAFTSREQAKAWLRPGSTDGFFFEITEVDVFLKASDAED
jgi:hypothetical protein